MKILLVNDYGSPVGGAEVMTRMLRDGLRRRGHDARIFASRAQFMPGNDFADYVCFGTNSTQLQVLSQTINLSAYWNLRQVLRRFQPDVVHVRMFLWQLSPLILPLLKNYPAIYHAVTYKPICPIGSKRLPSGAVCRHRPGWICHRQKCLTWRSWAPLMLQQLLWRHWRPLFRLIVTNSQAMKQALEAEGVAPVEVVWNGVPVCPPRPPLSVAPLLVYAGRLTGDKGVPILIQAFARVIGRLPEARLIIAGRGEDKPELERLITTLNLEKHITLTGYLEWAEMESTFAPAWAQVIPSLWAEPFGLVAVEAMMRGIAVIASDIGGLVEIVQHHRTGLLTPAGDIASLADAILKLLSNRRLAEEMGQAGRARALAFFSEDVYTEKMLNYYRALTPTA